MSETYSIELDLKEAAKMADHLDHYVRENRLYGTIGGGIFGGSWPRLTIGALLMRLRRLDALRDHLSDKQQTTLDKTIAKHAEVQQEWTVHYEGKLIKETASRLDAMYIYFDECTEKPDLCAQAYKPEVLRRTIVQEIIHEMNTLGIESADIERKARVTDSKLRGFVEPSDFVWHEILKPIYPENEFWWLYNRPPVPE